MKGIKDWEAHYSAQPAGKGRYSFRDGYYGVRKWSQERQVRYLCIKEGMTIGVAI